jgi:hypothetical protein
LDLARRRLGYKAGRQVFERCCRDDALRKRSDACHEMLPSLGVKLGERVVEQQNGRVPVFVGEQRNLGKEEREEQAALLAARRCWGDVAPANMEGDVVTVWADQCVPLIPLGFSGLIKRL